MRKIKITEKQASLLGLFPIKENEDDGLKSVNVSLGDKIVRIVVSGDVVPRYKDRILQLILRLDPHAKVGFFDATGKIVGNVKDIRVDAIRRDIKALDPNMLVQIKPLVKSLKEGVKNVIKITKSQYDRIFSNLNENMDLNRVDKSFDKAFSKDKDMLKESGDIKKEIAELIKFLYRKSENLSPFWKEHGITYEDICETLLGKNLIVKKEDGKYEVPKSLGSPQSAVQGIQDALQELLNGDKKEVDMTEPELETEDSGYPAGAQNDPTAPYNQEEPNHSTKAAKLEPVAFNDEIVIFKGPDGSLYVFYYRNISPKELMKYGYDVEVNATVISNYVNDNLDSLTKGEGLDAYENSIQLVKIDEPLKNDLLSVYDKNKDIAKVLGPIEEADWNKNVDEPINNLKKSIAAPSVEKPNQSKIMAKLADLKAKEQERRKTETSSEVDEMTSSASSGAFTPSLSGDIVKREIVDTPVVGETTVASAGNFQYDTPGFPNIGGNGEFKKGSKTKAEKTTQWAGGSFVKQPDCSKPNNNKSAENGGCNAGASSLKTVKTGGSINAPSLGENKIYETIALKTGKTIDEIKKIIASKIS